MDPDVQAILDAMKGGGAGMAGGFVWTAPIGAPPTGALGNIMGLAGVAAPPRPRTFTAPEQATALLSQMTPQQFEGLQRQLYATGTLYPETYYGRNSKPVNWGKVGDPDTIAAFVSATRLAAYTGNLDQILSIQAPPEVIAGGGGGAVRQPLVVELPDPDDLRATLKTVLGGDDGVLGREPTDEEVNRFVAKFNQQMEAYQRQRYAAGGAGLPGGPGGTVQQPPDVRTAASAFAREVAPVEAGAQAVEQAFSSFLGMIGSGGG